MITQTLSLPLLRTVTRRPLLMFCFSACILAAALAWRLTQMAEVPYIPPPAPIELSAPAAIARLEARLQQNPDDVYAYAQLGLGLLQQVRETGDTTLYVRAGQAFDEALQRDPAHLDALMGRGILATALHDFRDAFTWAEQAQAINPWRAETVGILVDANVELGRYEEAVAMAQKMVDLRPGLESYSRVSYLRELYGDVDGAIEAMRAAVDAGVPGTEAVLWSQVQLGHLYFNRGDLQQAEQLYLAAVHMQPDYAYGQAGLARVAAAHKEYAAAATILEAVIARLPLPEFVIMLGDVYEVMGQADLARQQRDLVHVMQQINVAAGMNVDLELAAFKVEYGNNPQEALALARAAYAARPTIFAADAVAWALYKIGEYDEAWRLSQEALRLGTQDALLHYHAGMIAQARGDLENAQKQLDKALTTNPYFSLRHQQHRQDG